MGNGTVLGIVGSPNRNGRTDKLVTAALEGAASSGMQTEKIQMSDHVVKACKDCLPWVCQTNVKCTYEDPAFEYLSEKILNCSALVLGSPVYWSDSSGLLQYLKLKMFRIYARTASLSGVPALGIAIAGGTGNGLITGLRPVYHFFQVMNMRALEPFPSTRFNFDEALNNYNRLGARLGEVASERHPFAGIEERVDWYDSLPFINLNRGAERRLLAAVVTDSLRENADPVIVQGLSKADEMFANGLKIEALEEVTRAYDAGVKAFDSKIAVSS